METLTGYEDCFRPGNYDQYDFPLTQTEPPVTTATRLTRTLKNATTTMAPITNATTSTTTKKPPPKPVAKELLLIRHCNVMYFPYYVGLRFPNLRSVVIWSSGLKYFDINSFYMMYYLEQINFQDNNIENLDENCFGMTTLTNLVTINLAFNQIKALPEALLSNVKNLQTFIVNNNQIENLPMNLFVSSQKLSFVNLNNNKIVSIAVDFTKARGLKKVLGINNVCADFFLSKAVDAKQLNILVRKKCPAKKT